MGKKSKIGKQRRDKYYHLAKETGYRSRAAFKLIQLNRKFEFLQRSRVCIDLCAAPGGWMQVAHENMPVSSIVIGVDLFPIKPVPGCIGIIGDITTDKCRVEISREIKTWKADVVLNDGAPNVGKNWLLDAYQQSCLTLSALKLATCFLRKGGWFVTKVFRSKDYLPLVNNFKNLFKKVHATKPKASRNESAEIFVVCQGFLAPAKVDQKFLDPKFVFADVDLDVKNKLNVFNPEKQKKAKALGYPDNDYTLYHRLSIKNFIAAESAIDALQDTSEIVIDDERVLNHKKTTKEIIECCKDIKVLGKKELRAILNWWKVLKDEFEEKEKEETAVEEVKKSLTLEEEEDLEDQKIMEDIENLKQEQARELKRKRKKELKDKKKLNEKMNLKMVIKKDEGPIMEEDEIFSLRQIQSRQALSNVTDQSPDVVAESDDEEEVERAKIIKYEKETGHLDSKGLYYKDSESELEFSEDESDAASEKSGLGISDPEEEDKDEETDRKKAKLSKKVTFENLNEDDEGDDADEDEDEDDGNPLLTDLDQRDKKSKKAAKAQMWFEKDIFKNIEDDEVDDLEVDKMLEVFKKKGGKIVGDNDDGGDEQQNIKASKAIQSYNSDGEDDDDDDSDDESDDDKDSDYDSDYNVNEVISSEMKSKDKKKVGGKDGFEVVSKQKTKKSKKRKLNAEDLALGSMLAQSKKTRRDLVDGAWNRFAFNDDNLPDWFVADEKKHMTKDVPVPQEMVSDYKKQLEDINARPIKKVMEAKARKKKRAARKLERAKKKVEAVIDNPELSEREKSKQIKSLYSKATKEPKKEITYVVAKRHTAQKRMARPPGVKGQYKVVDPRLKKDLRAQKAKEKTKGRGKKGGKGRGGGKAHGGKPPRGNKAPAPRGKKAK